MPRPTNCARYTFSPSDCETQNLKSDFCEKQNLKAAQVMVATGNCIYKGHCAPQIFVYTPGMYSSSNKDFVRTTVMDFYEMFKQTAMDPGNLAAFSLTNDTLDEERVCALDDFELELKVRNEAMKSSCASVQLGSLKKVLRIVRTIVDKLVEFAYIQIQIVMCFFRFLIPGLFLFFLPH